MSAATLRRPAALRLLVAGFCWLTALYAFLAASPFAFQEFIRPRMFGAGAFSDWHVATFWLWLVLAAVTLGDMRPRMLALAFVIVWTVVGVLLSIHPVLPSLHDGPWSLVVGIIALLPILWLALVDHLRDESAAVFKSERAHGELAHGELASVNEGRLFAAAAGSVLFITIVYAVLTPIAMAGHFEPDLLTFGLAAGLSWNLIYHSVVFCAVFLLLALVERVSRRASLATRYAVVFAVFSLILAGAIQSTICAALGFSGLASAIVAIVGGASIVATWGSLRLRRWSRDGVEVSSPFDIFFGPPDARGLGPWRLMAFGVLALGAYAIGAVSRVIDWDFLFLKSAVFALWIVTFDQMFRATPRTIRIASGTLIVACLVPLAAFALVESATDSALRHTLDRYTVYNPSFRAAGAVLTDRGGRGRTFDQFLRDNTGLGALQLSHARLDLVPDLHASPSNPAPFIFLFVIDSLRHDYLAAYNPAVTFTPRLSEFAADSLVFRHAFTRYGGTGLSLPAIWTGAVGVHRQYVQPFWPMNTLEKLLDANRYRRIMSVDIIMEQLLKPSDQTTELDRGRRTMDYELCRTIGELEMKLDAGGDDSRPVFGYSLPQDLHVSNILTASVPAGESYPGFHAPYAARVRRIDACFGAFVDFLKRRGWYDRSLIVVTADHGEMLGEDGFWGHVYYLFPPVIQVPLIVHLPRDVARQAAADLDDIALTTDITPTIYAALGYQPRRDTLLMGRPLIGPPGAGFAEGRRDDYVLAASYSASYASLRAHGRRLYIVDGVQQREYAYERDQSGPWISMPVTPGIREVGQRLIREHIYEINRVYGVTAPN